MGIKVEQDDRQDTFRESPVGACTTMAGSRVGPLQRFATLPVGRGGDRTEGTGHARTISCMRTNVPMIAPVSAAGTCFAVTHAAPCRFVSQVTEYPSKSTAPIPQWFRKTGGRQRGLCAPRHRETFLRSIPTSYTRVLWGCRCVPRGTRCWADNSAMSVVLPG